METLSRTNLPRQSARQNKPVESLAEIHIRRHPGKPISPFTVEHLYSLPDTTLLVPSEVADLFRVDSKTVTRWMATPKYGLRIFRTPGGHVRLNVEDVKRIYEAGSNPDQG